MGIEIVKSTLVQVTNVETLISSLSAWQPRVDVYVDPNGDARALNTSWNLYAVDGGNRSLIASGRFADPDLAPQRVLANVRGSGTTIALYAVTDNLPSGADIKVALVGWDPDNAETGNVQTTAKGTIALGSNYVTAATLAWQPEVSAMVDLSADAKAIGSEWGIFANFAGMAPILIASGIATDLRVSVPELQQLQGGCETWTLAGRTQHAAAVGAIGILFGFSSVIVFSPTNYHLDALSADLNPGDWVCLLPGSASELAITKATATALAAAGQGLSLVAQVYRAGATNVRILDPGFAVPNGVTGLGNSPDGKAHAVYIDGNARSQYLTRPTGGEFVGGKATPNGRLIVAPVAHITTSPKHVFNAQAWGMNPANTPAQNSDAYDAFVAANAAVGTTGTELSLPLELHFPIDATGLPYQFARTIIMGSGMHITGETPGIYIYQDIRRGSCLQFFGPGAGIIASGSCSIRDIRLEGKINKQFADFNFTVTKNGAALAGDTTINVQPLADSINATMGLLFGGGTPVAVTQFAPAGSTVLHVHALSGPIANNETATCIKSYTTTITTSAIAHAGQNFVPIQPLLNSVPENTVLNFGGVLVTANDPFSGQGTTQINCAPIGADIPAGTVATYVSQFGHYGIINECGIEFSEIGAYDVEVHNLIITGFRRALKVDGGEVVRFRDILFGGGNGGYTDVAARGDQSSCAVWIGQDRTSTSAQANGVYGRSFQVNGPAYFLIDTDGIGHHFEDMNMEGGVAIARIGSPRNVNLGDVICEGESSAGIECAQDVAILYGGIGQASYPANLVTQAQAFGLTLINMFYPGGIPAIKLTNCTLSNLCLLGDQHMGASASPPIQGAANLAVDGSWNISGIDLASPSTPICDAPWIGTYGTPINHATLPQAGLDVMLKTYAQPIIALRHQSTGQIISSKTSANLTANLKTLDQTISPQTNLPGSRIPAVLDHGRILIGGGSQNLGGITPDRDGASGVLVMVVVATSTADPSKLAVWRRSQAYYQTSGVITLVGAISDDAPIINTTGGAFTANPIFVVSAGSIFAQVTQNGAVDVAYTATITAVEALP